MTVRQGRAGQGGDAGSFVAAACTVACSAWCRSEMARLQEDVRRLRFWRSIVAELIGSLFVVFVGCAAFTVTYDEHSLALKVSRSSLSRPQSLIAPFFSTE